MLTRTVGRWDWYANCNISGQRLPSVSKWSLSNGAEINTPVSLLGKAGEAYIGFDGNYRTGFRTESGFDIHGWVR